MADLRDLEELIRARGRELAEEAANVAFNQTRDQCPVSQTSLTPGFLRQSLHYETFDEGNVVGADITADADYAEFTDTGSNPHVISGSPFLRFYWRDGPRGAGTYFFRFVNHPGSPVTHWFADPMPDRWRIALENAVS